MPKLVKDPEGAVTAVPTSFELPAGWADATMADAAATPALPPAPAETPAEQEAAALDAAAKELEAQAAAVNPDGPPPAQLAG